MTFSSRSRKGLAGKGSFNADGRKARTILPTVAISKTISQVVLFLTMNEAGISTINIPNSEKFTQY